ncbi:hypothetical protein ERJ75_001629600 [Trypanosoma vivax]|nr:hypothetical protein ERJ75_001629600 [Trypanosoma vivax]
MAGHSDSYHAVSANSQKGCPLTQFRSHTSVTSGGVITLAAALETVTNSTTARATLERVRMETNMERDPDHDTGKPRKHGDVKHSRHEHGVDKGATAAMTALAANATQTLATHRQLELACKQKRTTCSTPRQNAMRGCWHTKRREKTLKPKTQAATRKHRRGKKARRKHRHGQQGTKKQARHKRDMRTDTAKGTETQSTCTARGGTWDAQQGQCSTASGQKHRGAAMAAAASLLARTATTTGTRA